MTDDVQSRLSAALADRYSIERELGSGGMATVYLVEDLKQERQVAVKVLAPELAASSGADRFLRGIKTTTNFGVSTMRCVYLLLLLSFVSCSQGALRERTGYVDVPGARLYYEEAGEGAPLVMIHGGFLDRRMWDDQFETFARQYRTIRYDVRAHGLSRADSISFADHEDLRLLLEALNAPSAIVMGLSMGGQIAIDFALTHPEMVVALVLVGPGLSGFQFGGDRSAEYIEELIAAFDSGEFTEVTETFTRWWCDGPQREPSQVDSQVRRRVLDMLDGSQQRWEYATLSRQLEPPAIQRLAAIRAPTLAVIGGIDMPDIHEIVDLIAAQVPDAQKVVVPDVAHMVNMEKPRQFNEVVMRFLSQLDLQAAQRGR